MNSQIRNIIKQVILEHLTLNDEPSDKLVNSIKKRFDSKYDEIEKVSSNGMMLMVNNTKTPFLNLKADMLNYIIDLTNLFANSYFWQNWVENYIKKRIS